MSGPMVTRMRMEEVEVAGYLDRRRLEKGITDSEARLVMRIQGHLHFRFPHKLNAEAEVCICLKR
jgi:hypothetical protein